MRVFYLGITKNEFFSPGLDRVYLLVPPQRYLACIARAFSGGARAERGEGRVSTQVTGYKSIVAACPIPIGRCSRAVALLVLCGLLLVAAIAMGTGVILSKLRDSSLANAQRELQNIASVLAVQTDRAFKAVELIETSLIERLQALGIASAEDFERVMSGYEVHLRLKDKVSGWPHIGSLTLINSQGKLFNFSRFWPLPNIDVTDREFFKALKSNAQLTSFMGAPVRNRATGTWTFHLVRKVAGPNGEFLGLVLGAMEMQYFEEYFATIALAKDSSITLFRSDGTPLARHPHIDPTVSRSYPQSGLLANLLARADQGLVWQIGSIDGEERVIVAHRLAHYPFVMMVTTTVADALADWRREVKFLTGAAILLVLVLGTIVLIAVRQFRHDELLATARTEKAEAEGARALAEAELLKKTHLSTLGQLTATVAHELRNPLGAIRTTVPLLRAMTADKGIKVDRPISRIERSITRCDDLVSGLLDYSRSGEVSCRPMHFDRWLGEVLDEQALPEGITLERNLRAPDVVVDLDPDRFRRVIINLVDNAAQAITQPPAPGRKISISTKVADRLEIVISDTGPGIAQDVLPRLFEPFFSTKSFGTGLGLPTVKQIVEHHRGTIAIESQFGHGTSAHIALPLTYQQRIAA